MAEKLNSFLNGIREYKKEWGSLKPPNINIIYKEVKQSQIKWKALGNGWVKLNFDGAAKGNSGIAGYDCIVRDGSSKMIFSLCGHLGIATNNEAEAMTFARGLKHYSELALNSILIEGDSHILINAIKNESTPNWKIQQIQKDILTSLDKIPNYKVSHIF